MKLKLDIILRDFIRDRKWNRSVAYCQRRLPEAIQFYESLRAADENFDERIDIVLNKKLIYLQNPKVASTAIRHVLSELSGKKNIFFQRWRKGKYGNPPRIRHVGLETFFRLLHHRDALIFSFVRNPYDRLVSAWASKFEGLPLVGSSITGPHRPVIDTYLEHRTSVDPKLPFGKDRTLSFAEFVEYSTAVAASSIEKHITLQSKLIDLPGVNANFIGKYENFNSDMERILARIQAGPEIAARFTRRVNASTRGKFSSYYTPDLTERVYKAFELDFDRFQYPRVIPD
jgi:hypothetical protein